MSSFKGVPMKYRLLVIVFLPAIFLIWSVWTDYKAIQAEVRVQSVMQVSQKISILTDHIEAVSGLSKAFLVSKEERIFKEVLEFQGKVDKDMNELKEMAENPDFLSEGLFLKDILNPLFVKADSMAQVRAQVNGRTIGDKELDAFYGDYLQAAIRVLNNLSDQVGNAFSIRALFELISLVEQKIYAGNERSMLYQAFQEDKISGAQYIEFLQGIGMQNAFMMQYRDIAKAEEDQLYVDTFRGDVVEEAQKLQNTVIQKATAGKFGVSPKEWWEKQSAKMSLLQEIETKLVDRSKEEIKELVRTSRIELFVHVLIVLATLFISFLLIFLNLRTLARKLQEEINVLSTSGEEIGRSITETASGTSETATAVAETTTTVEELKQTALVATDKAKNVAEVSGEALKTLKRSETSVQATIQGMNSIQEGMGLISESIVKLSEHSQMIREIIDAVNDLAEQSHILAVNAAIESAKAGDQGKGFAVVAQEVRSLAEQSKQSTIQVRNILNDIQNATSSAVMAAEKGTKAVANGLVQSVETTESIRFLSLGINKVAEAASQIALSSQQQLIGVDQLTIAMSNIKTASNQQVSNMAQIETGIQGLNAVGKSLKLVIHECKM